MAAARKVLVSVLALSIMVAVFPSPAAADRVCATETVALETLELVVDSRKPAYRKGANAKFDVLVTRPLQAGGERIGETPVEGTEVNLFVQVGESFLWSSAITDHHGAAVVSLRLKRWIETGRADVSVFAVKEHANTPCLRAYEYGTASLDGHFRVRG